MSLQPLVSLYQYALTPLAPFAWFGLKVSSLELFAAFRLCYVLRHLREGLRDEHTKRRATDGGLPAPEDRSFTRDVLTTLTIVYGGEAIAAPFLGVPASFMVSGVGPLLYIATQTLVDSLPRLPPMAFTSELPLSFLDAHNRAVLVCTLVPLIVLRSPSAAVANSPWALLVTSFFMTNGGPFIVNLVSSLHPTPLALTTPAELRPYGWTTTDLWSAPLITALYATLTHPQPFWAELHGVLASALGGAGVSEVVSLFGAGPDKGVVGVGSVSPLDPETARSACALVLAVFFASRTALKFGLVGKAGAVEKIKTN